MNNWNPFQTSINLDDNATSSNGLGFGILTPGSNASSSSGLGFGLNRGSAATNGIGGGYSAYGGMRSLGQQQPTSTIGSASSSMYGGPSPVPTNRVTSPFSQSSSSSGYGGFDGFGNQRMNGTQQAKPFGSSGFQAGFGGDMNSGLSGLNSGFEKPMTNGGWNIGGNGYFGNNKPVSSSAVGGPTVPKYGAIGGMSGFGGQSHGSSGQQASFNEPGSMFQRSNSLNMGMYRNHGGQPQTSPPMSMTMGGGGSGGDIFSQADMFSMDSSNRRGGMDSNKGGGMDTFKAGRWDSGPSRPGEGAPGSQGARETGIIEKLLHSYGFIQCCERQARLFFHFSQFDGNIEHLKIGDPVEFEMTDDRRTGRETDCFCCHQDVVY
jgi:cold shock CspA family protein